MIKVKFVGGEIDGRTLEIPEIVDMLELQIEAGELSQYLPLIHTEVYEYIGNNTYKFKSILSPINIDPVFEINVER